MPERQHRGSRGKVDVNGLETNWLNSTLGTRVGEPRMDMKSARDLEKGNLGSQVYQCER